MVRGQYTAGTVAGQQYRVTARDGVDPDSRTETFVALRTEIASWRWAGVPFYIRTGKRLPAHPRRIVVNFREACAIYDAPPATGTAW